MRQKLYILLIALAALAMYTSASAQTAAVGDKFKADNLYYVITKLSPAEVRVAPQNSGSPRWDDTEMPMGDLTIPQKVTYASTEYTVTAIGGEAFYSCEGLTSVIIPDGITSIGERAFAYNYKLSSITLPENLTSIGERAFQSCRSLTSIAFPAKLTSIGNYAFAYCDALVAFTVAETNPVFSSDAAGALFDKDKTILMQYPRSNKSVTNYVIPATVTSIRDYAFYYCLNLTSITLPEGLTSIGDYGLNGCVNIASITLPASLTSIGKGAFINWKALTAFTVADGNPAFSSDAAGALFNKDKTTLLQIPKGNKSITAYTVPATVTGIEYPGFTGCDNIINITLPEGLTSIGDEAFWGCENLKEINCLVADPTSIAMGDNVFKYTPKGSEANPCILKVPVGSKEKYAAADQWKDFMPGIVEEGTGLASLTSHGIRVWGGKGVIKIVPPNFLKGEFGADVKVYDLTGTLVRTLPLGGGDMLVANIPAGKYIVKIGDAAEKVVVR